MNHADLLKLLLPPVSLDPNGPGLGIELAAEGNALDHAIGSGDQLLLEADPRTAVALLPDWERNYGLPEQQVAALGITLSFQERRAALVTKVTMQGGQKPAFFIALAATLGYTITVTECAPHTTEFDSEHPVYDEAYRFVWYVNAALNTIRDLTTEDDSEMATAIWGNGLLEAVINRYKPAHTLALFSYA
ncbi:YmfQ family protein [Oryzomicrobium sp.]|uniref:YmfQ family protein n=1 Tax=Oryzomicrobium sp. TaxID=1911578 RepID=UPI002FE1D3C5